MDMKRHDCDVGSERNAELTTRSLDGIQDAFTSLLASVDCVATWRRGCCYHSRGLLSRRIFNVVTGSPGAIMNADKVPFKSTFVSTYQTFTFSKSASKMDPLPSIREFFIAIYFTIISMVSGMAYEWLRFARSWPFCYDEPCRQSTALPNASDQTLNLRDFGYEQPPPTYAAVLTAPVSQAELMVLTERVKMLVEEQERMLSEIKELRMEVVQLKEDTKKAQ